MSDTIWLEVSDGQETSGGDRDNSAMLRLSDELDALAIELGVGKLTTFYDSRALAEAFAEELAEQTCRNRHGSRPARDGSR